MKRLIGVMLLAGSALFAAPRISVGIGVGAPVYAPPAAVAVQPPSPGPGYTWVDGYWANGAWIAGYWAPPAYYAAPAYPVYRHDRDWDRAHFRRDEHHEVERGRDGYRR